MSQQTARTRPSLLARRAAAVSAGAFALCVAGATPAMADLDPGPLPDLSPVTEAVSPVTDVVDPVVPVTQTVTDVEKTIGVSRETPRSKPKPGTKPTDGDGTTTRKHAERAGRQDGQAVDIKSLMDVPPKNYASWPGPVADMPGLRNSWPAAVADVEAPALAAPAEPRRSVISLAGGALQDLGDAGTPAGRTALVIVSMLVIGTLAGGHVKAAQDRLAAGIA